jgi:hypothetical protein
MTATKQWTCDLCNLPIAPGTGFVIVAGEFQHVQCPAQATVSADVDSVTVYKFKNDIPIFNRLLELDDIGSGNWSTEQAAEYANLRREYDEVLA